MASPSGATLHRLSTPRAAAIAGVVFAVLFGVSLVLLRTDMPEGAQDSSAWLNGESSGIKIAAVLMPFARISFLWFLGVLRDQLGRNEDRFFATVFFGSGLLFLAMMFTATAVAAALVAANGSVIDQPAHVEVVDFGKMVFLATAKTYALRMAAVFMISLATLWLRIRLMPGWLVIVSYLGGLTLLVVSDVSAWTTITFPFWVLIVSVLILLRADRIRALDDGDVQLAGPPARRPDS